MGVPQAIFFDWMTDVNVDISTFLVYNHSAALPPHSLCEQKYLSDDDDGILYMMKRTKCSISIRHEDFSRTLTKGNQFHDIYECVLWSVCPLESASAVLEAMAAAVHFSSKNNGQLCMHIAHVISRIHTHTHTHTHTHRAPGKDVWTRLEKMN